MVKLLHTSDVHIGAKLGWLGSSAGEHRDQIKNTFSKIIDKAISEKVDALLVSGDLFDTPHPSRSSINFVLKETERLANKGIYSIILPGNHDRLTNGSVFDKYILPTEYIGVLNSGEIEVFEVEEIGLRIFGIGTTKQFSTPDFEKLNSHLKRNYDENFINIAMVHGGVKLREDINSDIEINSLKSSLFDYIALGDWHGYFDIEDTKAWYSGSPEILARDQNNSGSIILIEFDDNKNFKMDPFEIGKRKSINYKIDLDELRYLNQENINLNNLILSNIKQNLNPENISNIAIEGKKKVYENIDLNYVEEELNKFFNINLVDNSKIEIDEATFRKFPETLIIGRFIKEVKEAIDNSNDPEQIKLYEDILQEGVSRLIN